jgi:hypothetical protein
MQAIAVRDRILQKATDMKLQQDDPREESTARSLAALMRREAISAVDAPRDALAWRELLLALDVHPKGSPPCGPWE